MSIILDGTSGITSPNETITGSLNTPNTFGFKNRIINGGMVIDQRNAGASQTVTTAGAYTVDRFFIQPTGASVTTQRVAGSSGYQYALRLTGTASVTQCFVQQKIEQLNSNDLAGQTVTVSFTASSSTLTSLTCYVEYASAADNWATFTTSTTQAITINSTATRYSFQATLSASATNGIRFIFSTGAFTSGTLDITGVQLEKGSVATSFDYRPYGTELSLCQRYYESTFSIGSAPVQNGGATNAFRISQTAAAGAPCRGFTWIYKTTKRDTPSTITSYNPSAANANVRNFTRSNDATISGVTGINTIGITFSFTSSAGSAVGDDNGVGFSADAEL